MPDLDPDPEFDRAALPALISYRDTVTGAFVPPALTDIRARARRRAVVRATVPPAATAALVVAAVATVTAFPGVRDTMQPPAGGGLIATRPATTPTTTAQPAAQRLRQLADVAVAAPAPVRPPGTVEHLRSTNWFLSTMMSRDTTISAVSPQEWESWRSDDNGGRLVQRVLPPIFQSEADRQAWLRDGGTVDPRQDTTDAAAGRFPAGWAGAVPTDPAALRDWIKSNVGEPQAHVEYLEHIAEIAGVRLLGPAQRSAVLRLLAELPGMTLAGTVVDRAGRTGEAFAMESDYHGLPTRYVIIVDPASGNLLAYQATLTATAGELNVRIPAVISYRCYLTAEYAPMPRR